MVSFVAVGALFAWTKPVADPMVGLGIAAALAVVGAVTELLSSRIDDNFSIPVVCAAVGALLL